MYLDGYTELTGRLMPLDDGFEDRVLTGALTAAPIGMVAGAITGGMVMPGWWRVPVGCLFACWSGGLWALAGGLLVQSRWDGE